VAEKNYSLTASLARHCLFAARPGDVLLGRRGGVHEVASRAQHGCILARRHAIDLCTHPGVGARVVKRRFSTFLVSGAFFSVAQGLEPARFATSS
jgi:hypothetical protein